MVVHADEGRVRKGLGQHDRRDAQAAADVENADARLEPFDEAVDRGQPLGDQRVAVEGAVEAGDGTEQARVVLVPAQAFAARVDAGELVDGGPHGGDELESGHQGGGALLLCEDGRGLDGQSERLGRAVVRDVAVRRLRSQPLLGVPTGDAGAVRELGSSGGPDGGERAPQAEAVAEVDEDRVVGRGLVGRHLAGELLELAEVQDRCFQLSGHGGSLLDGRPGGAVDDQGPGRGSHRPVTTNPRP